MAIEIMTIDEAKDNTAELLSTRFSHVRALSVALTSNLSDADATAQSMPDASPAKWHLAHTTWFFETFVLSDFALGYRLYDQRFPFLFNSYYETKGARIGRAARGLMTRPSLEEVLAYRCHVDEAMHNVMHRIPSQALELVSLGCHHEEQHQELLLTDILHLFAQNPLAPALWPPAKIKQTNIPLPVQWVEGRRGAVDIGHSGNGFAFDCETPHHTTWLTPHALANRLVTNGEWITFIEAGGYTAAGHWLSDGWDWVKHNAIEAPLYWRRNDAGAWAFQFGLDGVAALDLAAPVRHISFYEADAFARWAGARLPTEAEWESGAQALDNGKGNFLDQPGPARPFPAEASCGLNQMFGDVWEWTGSAYLAYPGFRPAPGAVGEYNGKFMSGQFVLKGGSCATPRGHARASYRNFFHPHQRWQFTGVRLAKDI